MKKRPFIASVPLLLSGFLISCDDNESTTPQKLVVQFGVTQSEISESTPEFSIEIPFNSPATHNTQIILNVDPSIEGVFTTEPAANGNRITIPVTAGNSKASLTIKTINNDLKETNKEFNFSIVSVPEEYSQGTNNKLKLTIKDDESEPAQIVANFIEQSATLEETNTEGIVYQIHLSTANASGKVKLNIESENGTYNTHFRTEPAFENGRITLDVVPGTSVASFKVIPITNTDFTGEIALNLSIMETSGNIVKGTKLSQSLGIKDDELAGYAKGYENVGADQVKKFYEYDNKGRVSKVKWDTYTPGHQSGADTYFYDDAGRLFKVNQYANIDILYQRTGDKVTKVEKVRNGIVTDYTELDYDAQGNIAGTLSYHRQSNGSYAKGFTVLYLYNFDGNIYKSLLYNNNPDNDALELIRTQTYELYSEVDNPFPMLEIIPGVKSQKKLPGKYTIEENGTTSVYDISYEFRPDGLPGKRIARNGNDIQTVAYHYY